MATTELALVDQAAITRIDTILATCQPAELSKLQPTARMFRLAEGLELMRQEIKGPILAKLLALRDTPLGFKTDRKPGTTDKKGNALTYNDATLRDAIIEALLSGASIIGNEFNVIAGSAYLTKNYFKRALREMPGLTELRIRDGVPVVSGGSCLVPMRASWKLDGVPDEIRCEHTSDGDYRIPVRVNEAMGPDAVIGKAQRKLMAKIYARVTGSEWAEDEPEEVGQVIDEPEAWPDAEWWSELDQYLARTDSIREIAATQENAQAQLEMRKVSGQVIGQLHARCNARIEEIRAARGPRSNQE